MIVCKVFMKYTKNSDGDVIMDKVCKGWYLFGVIPIYIIEKELETNNFW